MWPSIIGAAGSLLGGIVNRNSAKKAANQERSWAVEDQAEQFVRLRSAAEKGGFNPLTVLGAAPNSGMVGQTQAAQSYMGTAIADSALMLADSMAKTNAAATGKKLQNANRANAALSAKLTAATLRPKVAGVFDRPTKFGIGANAEVAKGSSAGVVSGNGADAAGHVNYGYKLEPFPEVDPIDPRRETDDVAVKSTPGFMVVDNPYFGRLNIPSLDGEEALHWYDYPDLVIPALQWGWNRGVPALKQSWGEHRAAVAERNAKLRAEWLAKPQKAQGFRAQHLGAK